MTAPILVALDVPDRVAARRLAEPLVDHVAGFKVGLELLMAEGPSVIADIASLGRPIFVDAKLHDIPNTVAGAARQLGAAGARWVTVHASGGPDMMRAGVEGLSEGAGDRDAGILAVTVLTSIDGATLQSIGVPDPTRAQVARLAALASSVGVEGAVCSPHEIADVREAAPRLVTVVPGIRPTGADSHDQARVATPAQAIARGATYLVIGRAITTAPDPVAAAGAVAAEIRRAGPADR